MWATNGGHAETMTVLVVTLRHEGRRRYDKIYLFAKVVY